MNGTVFDVDRRRIVQLLVVAAVTLAAASLGGTVAGETVSTPGQQVEQAPANETAFVVDLEADGDATVTWTLLTRDLDDPAEQEAFANLREDEQWQENRLAEFENQWDAIADQTGNETGREMDVSDTELTVETVDDTGVVRLSMTWDGLAASDGESVEVSEPFASIEETPWPLYVDLPEGYETTTLEAADEPAKQDGGHVVWSEDSSLDGFTLVAQADETAGEDSAQQDGTDDAGGSETNTDDVSDSETSADDAGPGFGVSAALAALVALLARRR